MSAKKIINYLGIFTVFSESLSFSNNTFFEIRCAYFILLFLVLLLLPYLCKIYFSKWFIFVFIVLIALSLQNVYLGNNRFSLLTKQILGISFFSLFFYLLVKFNNEDVFGLFKIYLRIAFFIGLIGLIQEIAFFLSLEWLYNYSHILPKWRLPLRDVQNFFRVNSIMPEPSSFCFAMAPAFFYSSYNLLKGRLRLSHSIRPVVIVSSFLFTLSTVGYIGLLIWVFILIIKATKRNFILLSAVAIISLSALFFFIPEFNARVSDTLGVITNKTKLEMVNLSTYTLVTNFKITGRVIKDNLFFGHGLGSYEVSYYRHIYNILGPRYNHDTILLNDKDANSLALRLLSETGLLGFLAFLSFIALNLIRWNKIKNSPAYLWLINNSILVYFILRLIRQGNYFSEGFFFFFWLYYFTKRIARGQEDENTH